MFLQNIYTLLLFFFWISNKEHSSRTRIKKLFDFNERSSNSLLITDYEGGNVSDHCWDKSAGIKSRMKYDTKIILSFFRLFHTFISALLVLEKETWALHNRGSGSIKQLFVLSLSHCSTSILLYSAFMPWQMWRIVLYKQFFPKLGLFQGFKFLIQKWLGIESTRRRKRKICWNHQPSKWNGISYFVGMLNLD